LSLFAFAGSAIQLVPDGTLLFHLLLIVGMVSLLNATLLKPINRVLQERDRRTKGRLEEAQGIVSSIGEKVREYEARLREARARGYARLEEDRGEAARERDRQVAAVKAEATEWRDAEKRKLKIDEDQAKAMLAKDAHAQALQIGGRILGRPITLRPQ
jgi:F-type H+-transporting ATPase subunit b